MELQSIMNKNVRTVTPDATLQNVAEQMRVEDVGAIPVCEGRKIVGVVTDRDIAIRSTARGDDPKHVKARDVMTKEVAWVHDTDRAEDVANTMRERQVRRIPVVNDADEIVGIVALADITAKTEPAVAQHALKGVSNPRNGNQ